MPNEQKKLTKSEMREDEFVEWILAAADYVRDRAKIFITGAGGLIALVVVIQLILQAEDENRNEAFKKLGQVWIAEDEGRSEDAIRLGEELISAYGGTPAAGRGVIFLANNYYAQERYSEARKLYQTYLNDYGDLDILVFAAWNGLAACFEAQGNLQKAAEKYQEYASLHKTSLQAPQALFEAARCYGLAGNNSSQQSLLKEITTEFSDSPVAAKARQEMKTL